MDFFLILRKQYRTLRSEQTGSVIVEQIADFTSVVAITSNFRTRHRHEVRMYVHGVYMCHVTMTCIHQGYAM